MSRLGKGAFMDCLSGEQGMKLVNIKFFRGNAKTISRDEFKAELCAAAERKRSGKVKAKSMPRWDAKIHAVAE